MCHLRGEKAFVRNTLILLTYFKGRYGDDSMGKQKGKTGFSSGGSKIGRHCRNEGTA
jgi:hypothetical protein